MYALGVTLEEMGEWAQANKAYDMFIEGYAKSELLTEVRMRRAETILQQGDAAQAEQLFADVAAVEGFAAADHALMRQAFCATRLDKMAEAAALYAAVAAAVSEVEGCAGGRVVGGPLLSIARRTSTRRPSGWRRWWRPAVNRPSKRPIGCAAFICVPSIPELVVPLADSVLPQAGASAFAANLRLDRADALYETDGRRADALNEYLAVYQAYPDHDVAALALYNAAFAALDLKQYDQALDLAGQFLQAIRRQCAGSRRAVHRGRMPDSEEGLCARRRRSTAR